MSLWTSLVRLFGRLGVVPLLLGCATPENLPSTPEPFAAHFRGYVLMEVGDFEPDLQMILGRSTRYPDGQSPTWIRADFDGNGTIDHAALLRTPSGSGAADEVFAIVLGLEDGRYELAHFESIGAVNDRLLLQPFAAGRWAYPVQSYDTGKEATRMVNAAVILEYFEASAAVIYWDEELGGFDAIPVSD